MIYLRNYYKIQNEVDSYDEVWAIVRSYKNPLPGVKHVPQLSPSWDLFKWFRQMNDEKLWKKSMFDDEYVPRFISEMNRHEPLVLLNELKKKSESGKNIALICFCYDESQCHRSVIGGILKGVGCEVSCEKENNDYIKYFNMLKEMKQKGKTVPVPTFKQNDVTGKSNKSKYEKSPEDEPDDDDIEDDDDLPFK